MSHNLCPINMSIDMNRENLIKTILKSVNMRYVITFQGKRLLQTNKIAFKLNFFESEFDATVEKECLSIDFC